MPFWRFQIANFSSAFLWAGVLIALGSGVTKVFAWFA
jgi:membrane protein DedA with SNARE-associated domain